MRIGGVLLGAWLAWGLAGPAQAGCSLGRVLDLPVTMEGHVPVVPAEINGQLAAFEVDSGAFYSTMSPGSAAQFQLKRTAAPEGFYLTGVGGASTTPSVVTVKNFGLGGAHIPNLQFLVAGNEFGHVGLLGQNLFSRFDVEYDLAHGAIRFYRDTGCDKSTTIAYWVKDTPYSTVKIQPVTQALFHTVGDITIDGATVAPPVGTRAAAASLACRRRRGRACGPTRPASRTPATPMALAASACAPGSVGSAASRSATRRRSRTSASASATSTRTARR